MHRAHPDDDWRFIDKVNRENNIKKVLELREIGQKVCLKFQKLITGGKPKLVGQ